MDRAQLKLIPVPKEVKGSGAPVAFCPKILCRESRWQPLCAVTKDAFLKIYDTPLPDAPGGVTLALDSTLKKGAYRLVCQNQVTLYAGDDEGARYALASFLQLVQKNRAGLYFPQVEIFDRPDKNHRGFMVDLARWWHPKRTVLAYLDLCFFYKIKYMHLHFADNQSYTLPSAVFPKLPTPGHHYSFEDIAEICAYAKARGIVLIPEIEMPGHAIPLNDAYPEIFMDSTSDGFIQNIGKTPTVVCPGSEKCFTALTKLIDEVIDLFADSPYIHLGGDEANTEVWEHCDTCRAYMLAHNLPSVKELYSEFTARVTDYVLQKGKTPIVWEGFPREAAHLISKDVLVMAWECYYNQPEDLLADGFKIINCAWKPLYICPGTTDWGWRDVLAWNVYNMQNFSQKSRATNDPVQLEPTDKVLGAQLCAWEACYEYEIHPVAYSMAAFTERLWTEEAVCPPEAFETKLNEITTKALRIIQEK